MTYITMLKRLVLLSFLLLPGAVEAAVPTAGEIAQLRGSGTAQARATDGTLRKLALADPIYSGDTISTGKNTSLNIRFVDGSRFDVGPQSEFAVDKFSYQQGADGDAFHSRIIKGAFRFVSGLIAKSKNRDMKVSTSVATIGVRGTQVQGEVTERQEKDGEIVDASAKIVLLEPEEKGTETSIIVSNEFGSVIIDKPGYGTEIPDEKSPPSPVRKMQLHTVDNILRALRSSVRQGGTPRPRMP